MFSDAGQLRDALIEFSDGPPDGLADLAAANPECITLIQAKGFGAFDYTTQALVVLAPTIIVQVAGLVKAHIEADRHVRIKVDGTEIEAPDADSALELLQQLRVEPDDN